MVAAAAVVVVVAAAALLSLVDEGKREKWVVVVPTCKSAPPLESLPPKTESSEDELSSALDKHAYETTCM